MTSRIVVGVDSEGSRQALKWAIHEAELRGAAVDALHTWSGYSWYGPGPAPVIPESPATIESHARELLATEIEMALRDHADVVVEQIVSQGSPARGLIDASKGAELVVVGSRGRGGFTGLLLGSVSQQVAHHAHCPVVIVR